MRLLERSFFERDVVLVARALLGKRLVRSLDGTRLGGVIIEAEAYRGEEDLACHARAGLTPRTAVMYGPAGHAYVYFTYGMHWMLNCVCGAKGFPAAVLLRAILPDEGLPEIALRRANRQPSEWCDGPAKLTQALQINRDQNGVDLCSMPGGLWLEDGELVPEEWVQRGSRIGLGSTPEPWLSMPWRFRYQPAGLAGKPPESSTTPRNDLK